MWIACSFEKSSPKIKLNNKQSVCSVGWFVSLLVHEEVLLVDLCERKILFQLKIYDRLRQATAKQTGLQSSVDLPPNAEL